jgi:tetratricopeptide (TPR) repeat protein
LRRLGKNAEAAAALEKMIATYPTEKSVRNLVLLADLHRRAGHIEAFKTTLQQAMKLDPVDGESSRVLANLLSEVGQVDDAVQILRDAAKREPNNPMYELILGDVLRKFGRNDQAIKLFEDLLKRYGDNEEIVKILRSSLSVIYVSQGNYAKGEAELEALLQRNPDEPGPNNDLGYLYAEQGKNLEKAEKMIRKALEESPDQKAIPFEYYDSLGWVLFKRGKFKEALEAMKKAAEGMQTRIEQDGLTPDTTVFEHLGDVYFQLQEVDKAADSWRQAMKVGEVAVPPDKRVAEIRKKLESLEKLGPIPKPSSNRTP